MRTAHDVTLRYDDNASDVVVATLKLVNVPTEPKLPTDRRQCKSALSWNWCNLHLLQVLE